MHRQRGPEWKKKKNSIYDFKKKTWPKQKKEMKTTIKYWKTTVKGECAQKDQRKTKLKNKNSSDYDNVGNHFSYIKKNKNKVLNREFNDKWKNMRQPY